MMVYLELIWSFLQVGLFSFGGGYAAMPLIQNQVCTTHAWLTLSEFTDIITLSQMTPGPIGINCATFTGIKVAGIPGGVLATVGCVIPSCVIVGILAVVYKKYKNLSIVQGVLGSMRPAVVALIASAGVSILLLTFFGVETFTEVNIENFSWLAAVLVAAALVVLRKWKPNPLWVMIGCGIVGGGIAYLIGI